MENNLELGCSHEKTKKEEEAGRRSNANLESPFAVRLESPRHILVSSFSLLLFASSSSSLLDSARLKTQPPFFERIFFKGEKFSRISQNQIYLEVSSAEGRTRLFSTFFAQL